MSEREKPLHVRVAEALGWKTCVVSPAAATAYRPGSWIGDPPFDSDGAQLEVPRYDTDWAATGPLIEKILQSRGSCWLWAHGGQFIARDDGCTSPSGRGETTLLAICNLILALHAAGKLKEAA